MTDHGVAMRIRIRLEMTKIEENNAEMKRLIAAFPENLIEGLAIANANPLKKTYPKIENIVICGMGGSGIGGKLVASWIADEIDIPIVFCQDYTLPNFVNEKTLIIASSYSGNTEEVISNVRMGKHKKASIIGICSGGKLQAFCSEFDYECIIVPGGNPPRTALGFSVIQLTHILSELDLISKEKLNEFTLAKKILISHNEEIHKEAKALAQFINGKELLIYCESKDQEIAVRARQQFNENCKVLVNHHVIPEMNHNELVGWYGGDDRYAVLFLNTTDWHPQNEKRLAFSKEALKLQTNHIMTLTAKGNTMLVRSLYLISIIDWASLYLAEKNSIDSVYIEVINELKASLLK